MDLVAAHKLNGIGWKATSLAAALCLMVACGLLVCSVVGPAALQSGESAASLQTTAQLLPRG